MWPFSAGSVGLWLRAPGFQDVSGPRAQCCSPLESCTNRLRCLPGNKPTVSVHRGPMQPCGLADRPWRAWRELLSPPVGIVSWKALLVCVLMLKAVQWATVVGHARRGSNGKNPELTLPFNGGYECLAGINILSNCGQHLFWTPCKSGSGMGWAVRERRDSLIPARVGEGKGRPLIRSHWACLTSGHGVPRVRLAMARFPGVAQASLFR